MKRIDILLSISFTWGKNKSPSTNKIAITKTGDVYYIKERYLKNKNIYGIVCTLSHDEIEKIIKIIIKEELLQKKFEELYIEDGCFIIETNYNGKHVVIINYYELYKKIKTELSSIIYNSLNGNISPKEFLEKFNLFDYDENYIYEVEKLYNVILPIDLKKLISFNKKGINLKYKNNCRVLMYEEILNNNIKDAKIVPIIDVGKGKYLCYDGNNKEIIEKDRNKIICKYNNILEYFK